jgi:hypothetical protein
VTVNEQTAFGFSGTMACVGIMGGRGDVPSYSEPRSAPRNRTNGIGKGSAKLDRLSVVFSMALGPGLKRPLTCQTILPHWQSVSPCIQHS